MVCADSNKNGSAQKETIESVNQMRIVADGYIQPLQEANQSLGQYVDGLIDEVDRREDFHFDS